MARAVGEPQVPNQPWHVGSRSTYFGHVASPADHVVTGVIPLIYAERIVRDHNALTPDGPLEELMQAAEETCAAFTRGTAQRQQDALDALHVATVKARAAVPNVEANDG